MHTPKHTKCAHIHTWTHPHHSCSEHARTQIQTHSCIQVHTHTSIHKLTSTHAHDSPHPKHTSIGTCTLMHAHVSASFQSIHTKACTCKTCTDKLYGFTRAQLWAHTLKACLTHQCTPQRIHTQTHVLPCIFKHKTCSQLHMCMFTHPQMCFTTALRQRAPGS